MNFFKRALYSVLRKKGKSLILLVIIFILGNVMAGSIAIKQATENVEKNIKANMGGKATIDVDYEKFYKENEQETPLPPITKELIEQVGKLPSVKYYDYNSHLGLFSKTLQPFIPEGMESDMIYMEPDFGTNYSIQGVQYPGILDIVEGNWQVTGTVFTDEQIAKGTSVAVISKKLAEENGLTIGDTITLDLFVQDYWALKEGKGMIADNQKLDVLGEKQFALEIIGIYDAPFIPAKATNEKNNMGGMDISAWQNYDTQNKIYVPNKVAQEGEKFSRDLMDEKHKDDEEYMATRVQEQEFIFPTFVLTSPDVAESFKNEVEPLLSEYLIVNLSSDGFEQVAGSLYTIRNISNIVLYVAAIATILILTLLIILFLRDRKHELGIYLALGEKRYKVIAQVFIEILLIAFVGISASLITGNMIASQVSESMLLTQMEAEQNNQNGMMYYNPFDTNIPSNEEIMENYEVKLNLSYVALIYGIGLGTVVIAVVGPMIYILRLNPKKIMM